MAIPSWATSMVSNYRDGFREKYGVDFHGTDEQVWEICNTIFDDADPSNEEAERLAEMKSVTNA